MSTDKAPSRRPLVCCIVFLALACIGLAIGVGILATRSSDGVGDDSTQRPPRPQPPVDDGPELSLGKYRYAAVTSENHLCNNIGTKILAEGGSAVDSAIAGLLCLGVVSPHYSGLGGGFFMTIYDKGTQETEKSVKALIAREVAPLAATQDMFVNSTLSSKVGGSAVAVPGTVAGFKLAHATYGRLPWSKLFEPAIALAKESRVSGSLAHYSRSNVAFLREHEHLGAQFLKDNDTYEAGDVIRQELLATTMQTIADEGPDSFYNGTLAQSIVDDLTDEGGIITMDDLNAYKAVLKPAVNAKLVNDSLTIYGPPPPSSAIVVAFILNIIEGYQMDRNTAASLRKHRLAEAMKFAFAKRSLLGDADFAENITQWIETLTSPDFAETIRAKINDTATSDNLSFYEPAFDIVTDSGTSHLSVMAADGASVSVTTSLNLYFGSKVRGSRTGVVFNNHMDDFSTPGTVNSFGVPSSPQNYIAPGKRPMSSMSPVLLVDGGGVVRANLGAAGGTRIITAIVQSVVNNLLFGMRLDEAVAEPRIHHQLFPTALKVEEGVPESVRDGLTTLGHEVVEERPHRWFGGVMAIVNTCPEDAATCVGCEEACIQATADWRSEEDARKGPQTDGY